MKNLLACTALLVACAIPALAQPQNNTIGKAGFGRAAAEQERAQQPPQGDRPGRGDRQNVAPHPPAPAAPDNARRDDRRSNDRNDWDRGDRNRGDAYRGGNDRRNWDRSRGPRRDFSSFRYYQRAYDAPRRFRGPSYRRPSGWYAHRWTFGEYLPQAFWARDYWLSDYRAYDLPQPPYGAIWVRVGDDALLIDQDTGEVITVQYSVFY